MSRHGDRVSNMHKSLRSMTWNVLESWEVCLTVVLQKNKKWQHLQWLQASSLHTCKLMIMKVSVFCINILKDVWYVVCRGTTGKLLSRLICRSLLIVRLKGPNRMPGAYAYASLLRLEFLCTSSRPKPNRWPSLSGQTILPLGSDFPIEGVNPLLGFYAAVKRLAIDGSSPHGHSGWYVDYSAQYPYPWRW